MLLDTAPAFYMVLGNDWRK